MSYCIKVKIHFELKVEENIDLHSRRDDFITVTNQDSEQIVKVGICAMC